MSDDDWHGLGIAASVICGLCLVAFLLAIGWGVACSLTGDTAALCR